MRDPTETAAEPPPPRRSTKGDARREQLVAIGVRLFGSRSYEEVQIEEIAREAGIAKGLLYHYFGNKRGLYLEVVRVAAADLLAALAPEPGATGADNLRRGLLAYLGFVAARAEAYVALMRGGLQGDPEVRALIESIRRVIVEHIRETLGLTRLPAPFRVAARSWIGGVEAAALDWLEHRDLEAGPLADLLAASLFGQLVVASGQSPGSGANIELGAGLRLLGAMLGGGGVSPAPAPPAVASIVTAPASRSRSGSRGSRRSRP
ncbi:MAG: TetR/AcrR family transcriptional regulator [Deltaproteobacteria bacterium]|nr:TetR/AcrR family transcriptional regulator [Deltaproteobacteria bacterium]